MPVGVGSIYKQAATEEFMARVADRVFNFSAGPAVLPLPVLEKAQDELLSLPGVGASVLEISHRSKAFDKILENTLSNLKSLLGVGEDHEVVLLQGGASLQFSMVPMNFLAGHSGEANYIVTGTWGKSGLKEASRIGNSHVAWDGAENGYDRLPVAEEITLSKNPAYLHVTSNETIQGVQWQALPTFQNVPLICDASSDFLSRPVDISNYGMLYACAQKNAGIAGVTVAVVRRDLLSRSQEELPSMLNYQTFVEKGSRPNTPPVFAVYILGLVCEWILKDVGGLEHIAARNATKASKVYGVIDSSEGFFRGHSSPASRSIMNVTFRLPSEELEAAFVKNAAAEGLSDLKGHRSVGGIRASIYNAMPEEGVDALCQFMSDFKISHG
ncbi:3-phosphoserine/phosphohydroxythreonine transaminase [Pirellulales bacterium]|nr:3-phosphoserine/phosphohydroxythreonine transaminase [Pirellulales bacterium]